MEKFGKMLISRPAGKEAYLAAQAYILPKKPEEIELDFSEVAVLGPSWADEFVTKLQKRYPNQLKITHINNASIKSTLDILQKK